MNSLAASIALALACFGLCAFASAAEPIQSPQDEQSQSTVESPSDRVSAIRLNELRVTAMPMNGTADQLARPLEVLAGDGLDARKAASLGETLSKLTGVQSSYFGPGVGRPIIRGLDGPRVQILAGGVGSQDASTVSADHAVSIEPFLADQIEVLKSTASLLYGSGAIGGAVNVVDGRIPTTLDDSDRGVSGRAELRGNTVSDEQTGMLRVDGSGGVFAFHVDLLQRGTDDYAIPGFAESAGRLMEEGETPDPASAGTLPNSALSTTSGAFGASVIGERGFVGASFSIFDSRYGIPGHAHAGDASDEPPVGGDEAGVQVDLQQARLDLEAGLNEPLPGHEKVTLRVGSNRYEHAELEGVEIGTLFKSRGSEVRLEAIHAPYAGWSGAYGLQYGRRDFSAMGDEAFVPPSITTDVGVFLVEEQSWHRLRVELGARLDRSEIDADRDRTRSFYGSSLSAAGRWNVSEALHLQLGLDTAERAPAVEELLAYGAHAATRSFEIGEAALGTERSTSAEFGVHWHTQRVSAKAAAYGIQFADFIYLADTGEEEAGLPVRQWTQSDARFTGFELEADVVLVDSDVGRWDVRAYADAVRARLNDGAYLPRIAPSRLGADIRWQRDGWRASAGALRYARQNDVALRESVSSGYTLVDAHLSYGWDAADVTWQVFLDATNLTNQEARAHTSFLKDLAPLPGRGIAFGLRAFF